MRENDSVFAGQRAIRPRFRLAGFAVAGLSSPEDEREAHCHADREHLAEERHAEQCAEHAFERAEQAGLGGGQVGLRHVLRHSAEGRREHGHVGHGADELGRGDLRHSGHRLRDQGEQQGQDPGGELLDNRDGQDVIVAHDQADDHDLAAVEKR